MKAIARLFLHGFVLGPALLALAACGGEPDEFAIQSSLEQMHQEWAAQQRQRREATQAQGAFKGLPRVDLGFEASLTLRITEVRKRHCRPAAGDQMGYVCVADISAQIAGRPPVARTIKGRFVAGWSQWVARDVQTVDVN